jgi:hypothetical protein
MAVSTHYTTRQAEQASNIFADEIPLLLTFRTLPQAMIDMLSSKR